MRSPCAGENDAINTWIITKPVNPTTFSSEKSCNSPPSEDDDRLLPRGHVLNEPVDDAVPLRVRRVRPKRPPDALLGEGVGGRRIRVLLCHRLLADSSLNLVLRGDSTMRSNQV